VQQSHGERAGAETHRCEAAHGKKGPRREDGHVIDGLPRNESFLKELAQDLKRSCGTGGTVIDGAIELHGDLRERLRDVLDQKGFTVKG